MPSKANSEDIGRPQEPIVRPTEPSVWTLDVTLALQSREAGVTEAHLSRCVDGSPGPRFSRDARLTSTDSSLRGWPTWTDELPSRSASALPEGGSRKTGRLKAGTVDRPLVTYVTVVRNNAGTLPRAIESVLDQTYPLVEHVILDGGSTDGTFDVLSRYGRRIDYFASEPDRGIYDALNKAIPLARGELICVLNSDDWLEPVAAQTAVNRLTDLSSSGILLTAAKARRGTDEEAVVMREWYPALVHPGCYFTCAFDCHNAIYATRSAYERSGPYDPTYDIAGDFKWIMRCLESNVEFIYTNEITVNYVLGGVSADDKQHGIECVRLMRERFPSLTVEEAGGLYHSFFLLPRSRSVPGRPNDVEDFIREIFIGHSDNTELIEAIAWASVAHADSLGGREDRTTKSSAATGQRPHIKDLVREALRDHPALYGAARRFWTDVLRRS